MHKKRLYCLLPNIEYSEILINQLKKTGTTERDIYIVTGEKNTQSMNPHKFVKLQKTELTHGLILGISVGSSAGLLGGLLAVIFPPGGILPLAGELMLLTTTLTGLLFGSVVSALVAADIPNYELIRFQDYLNKGRILLILNVPDQQFDDKVALIKNDYPDIGLVSAR